MALETAKDQIALNYMLEEKKDFVTVEGDIIVNDVKPDVLSIINTNGIVTIHRKEVLDNKVRIDGNINSYAIYLADDANESIRSLNHNLDFSEIINLDKCKNDMDVDVIVTLKNLEAKIINSRKINIKAILEITVKVYNNENFDMVTNIENNSNIQYFRKSENINVLKGVGITKIPIKDTIVIDEADEVAEIFKVKYQINNEEQKTSYNKILYKADFEIEVLYLTEDNRINSKTAIIPIMGFVDIQNINDVCECKVQSMLQNLTINSNSEGHSIYIDANLEVKCGAYENREYDVINDLYSITEELNIEDVNVDIITKNKTIYSEYTLNEEVNIPELTGKIYGTSVVISIKDSEIKNRQIAYKGEISIDMFFEGNKALEVKTLVYPFETVVNSDEINESDNINTHIFIKQENIVNKSNNNVGIFILLGIHSNIESNRKMNIIREIETASKKSDGNMYSMTIYFVKPGDTLWKIAKKFNSTVHEIATINNIEDTDKIYIGQQLFIPKYVPLTIVV